MWAPAPAIGIDLGTSYSSVSVWQNGKVETIPDEFGGKRIPSYVSFSDLERLMGNSAKNQMNLNSENTIFEAKRLIGRKYDDRMIKENMKFWPFKIIKESKSDRPFVQIKSQGELKNIFVEEIIAMILLKLKLLAENYLGKNVKDAVITVPAYFNYTQREIIHDSGTLAGLYILTIIEDPIAAAFAYGYDKVSKDEKNLLVFDFGGGNLSISIISLEDGLFNVEAVNGNIDLGGADFDKRLIEYCCGEFRVKTGIDITENQNALSKLKIACEKAKIALSSESQTTIDIDDLFEGINLNRVITRSKFEDLCMDLFKKIFPPLENLFKDSKMSKSQIDDVILFGGSTKIPKIRQMIQEYFNGKEPIIDNQDEAVSIGAAIRAAIRNNVKDEKIEKLVELRVTPFNLGVEINGGIMQVVIPKNSTFACMKNVTLYNCNNYQNFFLVQVYEGNSMFTKDNALLSSFTLDIIPPMPIGQTQIEITFAIDYYFNLNVIAKCFNIEKEVYIKNEMERINKDDFELLYKEVQKLEDEENIKIKEKQKLEDEENKKIKEEQKSEEEEVDYKLDYRNLLKQNCILVRQTINKKIDYVLKWINDNPFASKDIYDSKIKEVDELFKLVTEKINTSTGGAEDVE